METGIQSFIDSAVQQLQGAIGDVLPGAAIVFATLVGINLGVKLFKRITGSRT